LPEGIEEKYWKPEKERSRNPSQKRHRKFQNSKVVGSSFKTMSLLFMMTMKISQSLILQSASDVLKDKTVNKTGWRATACSPMMDSEVHFVLCRRHCSTRFCNTYFKLHRCTKCSVFWEITPSSSLKVNRRFGGTYLHLQKSHARTHREVGSKLCKLVCWVLAWLFLLPWRWRRHVPPKRRLPFNRLDGVISQKTEIFITTYVRTSDPKYISVCSLWLL
jgi:hypothetical protein